MKSLRRVAIIGGVRIPFARQYTNYAEAGNVQMLAATLQGLVQRFGLKGERVGEVAAGAVIKHSRDTNISREALLDTELSPQTPAYDVQQACTTSLETAILVGNKIALGQIDVGIAGGADSASDAPVAVDERLRRLILRLNRSRSIGERFRVLAQIRPSMLRPAVPNVNERRTGLSMGEHCELMVKQWQVSRESQDDLALASHQNGVRAYAQGFYDDLLVPYLGIRGVRLRSPEDWIESLDKMIALEAEHLIPGHTRPISGAANVRSVLTAYRDGIKSILDQTLEGIRKGARPDELV